MFSDQISGSKADRQGLKEALEYIRPGDSLVVWRLDRLGRNLRHLIDAVEDLEKRKVGLSAFRKVLIQQQMVES